MQLDLSLSEAACHLILNCTLLPSWPVTMRLVCNFHAKLLQMPKGTLACRQKSPCSLPYEPWTEDPKPSFSGPCASLDLGLHHFALLAHYLEVDVLGVLVFSLASHHSREAILVETNQANSSLVT